MSCFALSLGFCALYKKRCNQKRRITAKEKAIYAILIMAPIVLIQGFRYDVGTDYLSYEDLSIGFGNGNKIYYSWYLNEPLFVLLSYASYHIAGNGHLFFLLDAIIMNCLLFKTFDYYKKNVSITILYAFYYFLCFPYFLNTERQGLASIIVWYSSIYAEQRKFRKFFLCIVVATLFHNTAIIGIVFYAFNFFERWRSRKYIKRLMIGVAFCVPIIFGFSLDFLSKYVPIFRKYTRYLNDELADGQNVNHLYMLLLGLALLSAWRILKRSNNYQWLIFLYGWQLSSYLLNNYLEWGFRLSYYFEIGIMYGYAYVIPRIGKRVNRMLLNTFATVMLVFYFTYKFLIQGNSEIFPYTFIWDK